MRLTPDRTALDIIDQTLLPGQIRRIRLEDAGQIWDAIRRLQVRGAPAIGVAAGLGLALLGSQIQTDDYATFVGELRSQRDYLASSRPTAVNLFWALDRVLGVALAHPDLPVARLKEALFAEAEAIRDEDVQISRSIGELGFSILEGIRATKPAGQPVGVLTHCNAGTLATARYGTATAPLYTALTHGWKGSDLHVYCDETRPLLQGARLTAFELAGAGIATTLQCDDMAASLMARGLVDVVFVGCDRVAKNGDAANKIGTSGVAILARHFDIPFFVCAPSSTIDLACETGADIPIEMRDPQEVTTMWYREKIAPSEVDVYNPAFDVTDHGLLTGIICERGILLAPFDQAFEQVGIGSR